MLTLLSLCQLHDVFCQKIAVQMSYNKKKWLDEYQNGLIKKR